MRLYEDERRRDVYDEMRVAICGTRRDDGMRDDRCVVLERDGNDFRCDHTDSNTLPPSSLLFFCEFCI